MWITKYALTRFANSTIHQNMLFENGVLKVRAVFGKKVASGTTNRLDEAGVRALVDDVVRMARLQDENPDFVSLPKPVVPIQSVEAYYDSTARSTPEQRAEAVRAVISEADKVGATAAGSFTVQSYEHGVKNTLGHRRPLAEHLCEPADCGHGSRRWVRLRGGEHRATSARSTEAR